MVYGDRDVAGPIVLDNGDSDMFWPGKLDEFDVSMIYGFTSFPIENNNNYMF